MDFGSVLPLECPVYSSAGGRRELQGLLFTDETEKPASPVGIRTVLNGFPATLIQPPGTPQSAQERIIRLIGTNPCPSPCRVSGYCLFGRYTTKSPASGRVVRSASRMVPPSTSVRSIVTPSSPDVMVTSSTLSIPNAVRSNLISATGEIRHRIRLVTGPEHKHVIAGTTCQPVITRPANSACYSDEKRPLVEDVCFNRNQCQRA